MTIKVIVYLLFFAAFNSTELRASILEPPIKLKLRAKVIRTINVPLIRDSIGQAVEGSPSIELSYKVLNPDSDKPYMFFSGGGPGMPSIDGYRLEEYAKYYRVVIIDQRGVGMSTQVDHESNLTSSKFLFEHFSTKSHTEDMAYLVDQLTRADEEFYIAGHSYGGEIVANYISRLDEFRRPSGALFLAPGFPGMTDGMQGFVNQRTLVQIDLNKHFFGNDKAFQQKIIKAKRKIKKYATRGNRAGLLANELDTMFYWLSVNNVQKIKTAVDKILNPKVRSASKIKNIIGNFINFADPLGVILDWSFGERVSQVDLVKNIPPEIQGKRREWMLLEANVLLGENVLSQIPEEDRERVRYLEQELEGVYSKTDLEKLDYYLKRLPIIIWAGEWDHFIPYNNLRKRFQEFANPEFHYFHTDPQGDHWNLLYTDPKVVVERFRYLVKKKKQIACKQAL